MRVLLQLHPVMAGLLTVKFEQEMELSVSRPASRSKVAVPVPTVP